MTGTDSFVIPPGLSGKRADIALSQILPQSRSRLSALIKSGSILMNGKRFKPSAVLEGGERIVISTVPPEPYPLLAENIPVDVVFEDADLIAINKRAGMVVHPGAGCRGATLVNALLHRGLKLPASGGPLRPGIVHRLDKNTSGVIVVAKNDIAHTSVALQFKQRTVRKELIITKIFFIRLKTG